MTDCLLCGGEGCESCTPPAARAKQAKSRKPTAAQERKAARRAAPAPKVVEDQRDDLDVALQNLDLFGMLSPLDRANHRMRLIPKIATPVRVRLAEAKRRLHE